MRSHYDWLEKHMNAFMSAVGLEGRDPGIVAHGDKCSCYQDKWRINGIPFSHGVAIYLISYWRPYSEEVRGTGTGWVAPDDWVVNNYERFKPYLTHEDLEKLDKLWQ